MPARLWLLSAVLLAGAGLGLGVAPAAGQPIHWSAPQLIEHQPHGPYSLPADVSSVSCPSASLCVAYGEGNVMTSQFPTGGRLTWTLTNVDAPAVTGGVVDGAVSCPSTTLCVVVSDAGSGVGHVITSTDPVGGASAWQLSSLPYELVSVSCPTTSLCVAGTRTGDILTSTNPTGGAAAWTAVNVDSNGSNDYDQNELSALACPTTSLCIAGDRHGNLLTSNDPTGGAGAWTLAQIDGANAFNGASCDPTGAVCVAVDTVGNVLTSTDPSAGASSWTAGSLTGQWTNAVTCPSASLCIAVGPDGKLSTTTDPAGGASTWTVVTVPSGPDGSGFLSIGCASPALCVAGQFGVWTSINPTGGPGAWQPTSEINGVNELTAIACPSTQLCVAADDFGNVITATTPAGPGAGWTATDVAANHDIAAVSCASPALCVGVDRAGDILWSTDPAGGLADWRTKHIDGHRLTGVSCPATKLCIAVDGGGQALALRHLLAPPPTWTTMRIDSSGLTAISCPSMQLCVAVDGHGRVVVSTDPATPHPRWRTKRIDHSTRPSLYGGRVTTSSIEAVDCPSRGLCLAGDVGGYLFASTDPAASNSRWTRANLDYFTGEFGGEVGGISCQSTALCVALQFGAFSSTEPASPTSWQASPANIGLRAVSCAPSSLCVAVADGGVVLPGSG